MFTTSIWPSSSSTTNFLHRSSDSICFGQEMTDELFFLLPSPSSSKPASTCSEKFRRIRSSKYSRNVQRDCGCACYCPRSNPEDRFSSSLPNGKWAYEYAERGCSIGTQTNIDDSELMDRAVLERIAAGILDLADEFESDLVALRKQQNSWWSSLLSGGKSTVAAAVVFSVAVSYMLTGSAPGLPFAQK
ncbi:hypothetical protein Ddc_11503 [Ditylenchus destructor]|nr:hypothetical protein Ddc_11503 [Ditylenchus destructor]